MFERLTRTLWPLHDQTWRHARALFVISTGRVGTVSLIQVLNLSPLVEAHHEPQPTYLHLMPQAFVEMSQRPRRYARLFARARAKYLYDAARRGKVFAESTLFKHYAPVIADLMPQARFLHVHRHPGGVIRSTMRRGWYASHGYDRYRPRPGVDDPNYQHWPTWSAFEKNCWLWATENEQFLRLAASIGTHRVMQASFDQLFNPDSGCAGRMFDFMGVPRPSASALRQALTARHNEQQTGQFPVYEEWTEEMLRTLDQMAGITMAKLGYDRPFAGTSHRIAA